MLRNATIYRLRNNDGPAVRATRPSYYLSESWRQAVDNNLVCAFIGFRKASDCVSHRTLLHKLNIKFGMEGNVLSWPTDYLHNRIKVTVVNSTQSEELNVTCGIPQRMGTTILDNKMEQLSPIPPKAMMKGRKEQKRAILASLKWGEGWSRSSIYFVQDCRPVFDMLATVTAGNLWLFKRKEFHCELEIVFTIAAPAFDILFIGKDYHWV